jgi:hypothetical protein
MPDPIPRNRSAHGRRSRRQATHGFWRGRPRRQARDDAEQAGPAAQLQCTPERPEVFANQPLRRPRQNAAQPATPPAPAPAPAPALALPPAPAPVLAPVPLPGMRDVGLGQPFRRSRQNTAHPELPPSPSPDLAIGPGQPLRRPRPNAGHPEPTPPPRQARARQVAGPRQAPRRTRRNVRQPGRPPSLHRTDLIVGGLVSAAALVVGIVAFPLLPSGTFTGSTTPPPASDHAGTAVASSGDPGPVGGQLAIQPSAPASPDHAATRGGVTLLSDQTAVHRSATVPVVAPPAPAPQVAVPSGPSRSSYEGSPQPADLPQVQPRSVPTPYPSSGTGHHSGGGTTPGDPPAGNPPPVKPPPSGHPPSGPPPSGPPPGGTHSGGHVGGSNGYLGGGSGGRLGGSSGDHVRSSSNSGSNGGASRGSNGGASRGAK